MNDNVGSGDAPHHRCCHWKNSLKKNRKRIRSVVMPRYKG